jgi:hypothetical protein
MTIYSELENVASILREHLHLTQDELEGYAEGTLGRDEVRVVEDHLRDCRHCSEDVELISEIVSEPEPGTMRLIERFGATKVLPFLRPPRVVFDQFWLGDDKYALNPDPDQAGLLLVVGLYLYKLSRMRRRDRDDPGSVPVAVEAYGKEPIVACLSSFEAAGDFKDPIDDEPSMPLMAAAMGLRLMAPILPAERQLERQKRFLVFDGKAKREEKKQPKPKLILKCRAKSHDLGLYYDEESDEIFLSVDA